MTSDYIHPKPGDVIEFRNGATSLDPNPKAALSLVLDVDGEGVTMQNLENLSIWRTPLPYLPSLRFRVFSCTEDKTV